MYKASKEASNYQFLTAFVLLSHGSDEKKYVVTGRRIMDALKNKNARGSIQVLYE